MECNTYYSDVPRINFFVKVEFLVGTLPELFVISVTFRVPKRETLNGN